MVSPTFALRSPRRSAAALLALALAAVACTDGPDGELSVDRAAVSDDTAAGDLPAPGAGRLGQVVEDDDASALPELPPGPVAEVDVVVSAAGPELVVHRLGEPWDEVPHGDPEALAEGFTHLATLAHAESPYRVGLAAGDVNGRLHVELRLSGPGGAGSDHVALVSYAARDRRTVVVDEVRTSRQWRSGTEPGAVRFHGSDPDGVQASLSTTLSDDAFSVHIAISSGPPTADAGPMPTLRRSGLTARRARGTDRGRTGTSRPAH